MYHHTICFETKISRSQDVSEKVLGQYIQILRDITYISTISIIILASYAMGYCLCMYN